MREVEFIPAEWVERAAWAASYGEHLVLYSRPIQIEHRCGERRAAERPGIGRRTDDPVRPFQSLQPEELTSV